MVFLNIMPERVRDDKTSDDHREVSRNPIESYNTNCMNWKRNPMFTDEDNDRIWMALSREMVFFGYLKDGHSEALLIE